MTVVAWLGLKFGQEFRAGEDVHSGEGEELFAEVFELVPYVINLFVDYQKTVVSLIVGV